MEAKKKIKRKSWTRQNLENGARHKNLQPKYQRIYMWVSVIGIMTFTLPILAIFIYWEASYNLSYQPDSLGDWITVGVILVIGLVIFLLLLTLGLYVAWGLVALYFLKTERLTKEEAKALLMVGRFPNSWFDTTFD